MVVRSAHTAQKEEEEEELSLIQCISRALPHLIYVSQQTREIETGQKKVIILNNLFPFFLPHIFSHIGHHSSIVWKSIFKWCLCDMRLSLMTFFFFINNCVYGDHSTFSSFEIVSVDVSKRMKPVSTILFTCCWWFMRQSYYIFSVGSVGMAKPNRMR